MLCIGDARGALTCLEEREYTQSRYYILEQKIATKAESIEVINQSQKFTPSEKIRMRQLLDVASAAHGVEPLELGAQVQRKCLAKQAQLKAKRPTKPAATTAEAP